MKPISKAEKKKKIERRKKRIKKKKKTTRIVGAVLTEAAKMSQLSG